MKKVALLGTAPSSMLLAPFQDKEWDIWACSPGTASCPRVDRRYELHRWEPGREWFSESYVKLLAEFQGPVVMACHIPEVPGCKILDWEGHVERFSPYFFTSTLAWMMADAIVEGYEEIMLYGVDMAATTEYLDQRLGCQYFALIAGTQGIKVSVPPESDLLRPPPLYGVCEHSHLWIKETARAREMAQRMRDAIARANAAREEEIFLKGVLDDQDWHLHSAIGAFDFMTQSTVGVHLPQILRPGKEESDG